MLQIGALLKRIYATVKLKRLFIRFGSNQSIFFDVTNRYKYTFFIALK